MERGVYAQGWYARQHNYHPSRPARRLKMLDDFTDYRATMLTWPALGGGGISLPYLEQEAAGEIPARFRFYGYVTDQEFNHACSERGIKAFGVIFLMQGWEFPAELSEDEDEVLSLNELRGVGKRTRLGLREFTQNTYPRLWNSYESYFPGGLRNSEGDVVTDLWEECCSRDIHGEALRADWLECPDREHICHLMDTNNPVWREYVKAVIRIQVDAGVDGIQFDEPDGPMGSLKYGGCFCKDCMKGFTAYLRSLPARQVPADVAGALDDFHYGRWLLAHGADRIPAENPDFLARAYVTFVRARNAANFHELASYAREYAARAGRSLLISANLYDGAPWHDPLAADVDVLVPEQRHTLYRQPGWMRYIAAFGGEKPVTISFNPYGGILPALVEELNDGRGIDRYRTMMYEAAALGANMSVPYGAWMGSVIEDAMYAPHNPTKVIQGFLADNEHFYTRSTVNDTAVVYSMDSNLHDEAFGGAVQARLDPVTGRRGEAHSSSAFFGATDALARAQHPFDVVIFHDGVLREDDVTPERLRQYRHLVLPDCWALSGGQVDAVAGYLDDGGRVIVIGDLRGGDDGTSTARILEHPGTRVVASARTVADDAGDAQVEIKALTDVAVNLQRTSRGTVALHIVNYEYDDALDRTAAVDNAEVSVRLPEPVTRVRVHTPGEEPYEGAVSTVGDRFTFTVRALSSYLVVELL
ncbi:hypothetical protein [Jiangella asiatica]|uniref:Beta-galactosidase trimerisation domain-containing protein n=1 Tax=Jiangella asiatica TaxID=2530372 RepID=A0A4R5D767_9ACTN|nr:hypothetical protein [Jiangella asiatica]TDE08477.1 hypothetical protein E1269_17380 [Jiangella asiatica]